MENGLNNIKFSSKKYEEKFLATEKQKDFILDYIDYIEDDKQANDIIKRLDTMTKKEASELVSHLLDLIELSDHYDEYYYDGL